MRGVVGLVVVAVVAAGCGSVGESGATLDGTRAVGAPTTGPPPPTTIGTLPPLTTTRPSSVPPSTAAGGPTSTAPGATASALGWQTCGQKLQCATLTVPLDHADATKGTIDLFVKRRPAGSRSRRIGTLLTNPGGPGVPGTVMVDQAVAAFGPDLIDRFDIVAWDPRGVGKSGQVLCVDNLDPYFALDMSPDDAAERQKLVDAAKAFDTGCGTKSAALLPYISTESTARDMDAIRRALGEDKISYFGFSYGSELGAVWATLFPATVRAMVIDGSVDPNAGAATESKQAAVGLERALTNLLTACAKDRTCPINNGGNPGALFDRIMAELDRAPLTVRDAPGRPPVNQGVASWAVVSALYDQAQWLALESALAEAQKGNGRPLLEMYDAYLNLGGSFPHAFEALVAINCLDDPEPADQGGFDALDAEVRKVAPRMGPFIAGQPFCVYWPVRGKPPVKVTGKGAGPIVVVGTTGDPVTPIEATANMAKALEGGILVTAEANQHTGYQTSQCVDDAVEGYLLDLRLPSAGLVCKA